MTFKNWIIGGTAGAIGIFIGLLLGPDEPDLSGVEARIADATAAAEGSDAKLAERLSSIEALIGEANERISAVEASVKAGAAAAADSAGEIGGAVAEAGSAHVAALETGLAQLRASVETLAAAAAAPDADFDGLTVGQTAIFGDGAVRVFVSRIDADLGSARVVVGGLGTRTIRAGESIDVMNDGATCVVALEAIADAKVKLGSSC